MADEREESEGTVPSGIDGPGQAAGVVTDHPAGTRRVYSVDPAGLAAIRDYFDQFWQQSLARFGSALRGRADSGCSP